MAPVIRSPQGDAEWQAYYTLRWQMLRAPHDQPPGSERDDYDTQAWHLAAFDGERVIAVGRLHRSPSGAGQIRYMAVHPDYRRQQLGSRVLTALEQLARERGLSSIVLNARNSVLPFYLRAGYQIRSPGPLLYGQVPHTLMSRELG